MFYFSISNFHYIIQVFEYNQLYYFRLKTLWDALFCFSLFYSPRSSPFLINFSLSFFHRAVRPFFLLLFYHVILIFFSYISCFRRASLTKCLSTAQRGSAPAWVTFRTERLRTCSLIDNGYMLYIS